MRAVLVILALTSVADARPKPRSKRALPVKESVLITAPDPNEMSPADGQIALSFFDHFMLVMKGAMDCSTVASRINFVIDHNRELIRLMSEATAKGIRIPKDVQDKLNARMMKDLMPVLQACISDPDVMAALERFQPRKPQPPIELNVD